MHFIQSYIILLQQVCLDLPTPNRGISTDQPLCGESKRRDFWASICWWRQWKSIWLRANGRSNNETWPNKVFPYRFTVSYLYSWVEACLDFALNEWRHVLCCFNVWKILFLSSKYHLAYLVDILKGFKIERRYIGDEHLTSDSVF